MKKTASWCPPCGGWGWDLFEDLIADNEEKAILWALHYSGDLTSATAQGITSNLSGAGQPLFFLNTEEYSGGASTIQNNIMAGVNTNASQTPTANAFVSSVSLESNQINVNVQSKFFTQVDGEYYVNVYVVENDVVNAQAGQGNNAVHEKVLRDEMAGTPFGALIAQGTIMANASFSDDFSIPVANSWDTDHIELTTVIWKKNGSSYEFVNGTETTSIIASVQTPVLEGVAMSVSPNPVADIATIDLEFTNSFSGTLGVYDLTGRLVQSMSLGNAALIGSHTMALDASQLEHGMYFIRLSNEQGLLTRKMVVSH